MRINDMLFSTFILYRTDKMLLGGGSARRRTRLDDDVEAGGAEQPLPAQLPASRWTGCAKDAACCLCAPCKSLILWVAGVLVVVAILTIALIALVNQTPQGSAMMQTLFARITAAGEDRLIDMIDTFGGEFGQILSRIHFSSTPVSALAVIPAGTATIQGWVETRRDSVRVVATVLNVADWSTLVLVRRFANQTIALYTLLERIVGSSATAASATITCQDPLHPPLCQQLLEARLSGDRLTLVVLAHPITTTIAGLPPAEEMLLQANAVA